MTTNYRDNSDAEFAQSVRLPPSNWKVTGTILDNNDFFVLFFNGVGELWGAL